MFNAHEKHLHGAPAVHWNAYRRLLCWPFTCRRKRIKKKWRPGCRFALGNLEATVGCPQRTVNALELTSKPCSPPDTNFLALSSSLGATPAACCCSWVPVEFSRRQKAKARFFSPKGTNLAAPSLRFLGAPKKVCRARSLALLAFRSGGGVLDPARTSTLPRAWKHLGSKVGRGSKRHRQRLRVPFSVELV